MGTPLNNAVRAFAAGVRDVYGQPADVSSDAALALPVEALNTDYIVQTYTPAFYGFQFLRDRGGLRRHTGHDHPYPEPQHGAGRWRAL
jgi:hypothetical protein